MPKILLNRSSKTLSAANMEAIEAAIQTILDNLGVPIAITDADYDPLPKLGNTTKLVCDDVLKIVEEHTSYLETEQPLEEVYKDKTYNEQMTEVVKLLSNLSALRHAKQGCRVRNTATQCPTTKAMLKVKLPKVRQTRNSF